MQIVIEQKDNKTWKTVNEDLDLMIHLKDKIHVFSIKYYKEDDILVVYIPNNQIKDVEINELKI